MGTWSIPETVGDINLVNKKIRELNRMKDDLMGVAGDDELLDNIESTISRIGKLRDWGLLREGLETVHQAINCPVCLERSPDFKNVYSTDSLTELYLHLIGVHGLKKDVAREISYKEVMR